MKRRDNLKRVSMGAALATTLTVSALSQQNRHASVEPVRPDRSSPVAVLSNHDGSASVTNRGRQTIHQLCGVVTYLTPNLGQPVESYWSMSLAGQLMLPGQGLAPGKAVRKPPAHVRGKRGVRLEEVDLQVTGVVFSDGSSWGPEGRPCADRLFDSARAARAQVAELLRLAKGDPARFENEFPGPEPLFPGLDARAVHRALAPILIDESGLLRPGYKQRLAELVDRLGRY